MGRRFLILHGWENHRPQQHWQWWLTEQLRSAGEQVLYPQLPDPDQPSLTAWTELLHAELAQLGDGERIVVAHSLGATLWLHAAAEAAPVDRVLLVAPPTRAVLAGYAAVAEFAEAAPGAQTAETRLVCSDNDPYCPEGVASLPDLDADVITGGGHLNIEAGYGPWPSVLAWCVDPATRISGRSGRV